MMNPHNTNIIDIETASFSNSTQKYLPKVTAHSTNAKRVHERPIKPQSKKEHQEPRPKSIATQSALTRITTKGGKNIVPVIKKNMLSTMFYSIVSGHML